MNGVAFRFLPALILVAYFAHRAYYFRKLRHASDSIVRQLAEPGALVNLLLLGAVVVSTAAYAVAPKGVRWGSFPLPGWLRWTGLGLAIAAFALLQWAQSALGRNWSIRVQLLKEHEL